MTCAACSARVQRTLEKTPGVSAASVSLITGSARVDFDPGATTPDQLVEAIRGTGYGAELPSEGESVDDLLATRDELRAGEITELRRKFALSLAAAVLTMLFSMPLAAMVPGSMADPLMRIMMPLLDGMNYLAP